MPRWWLTRVRGGSMAPALRDGQLALTRSLRPGSVVRRGDLVVAEAGRRVVKRVVGLPGERVTFRGGGVLIDGIGLAEPYATASFFRGELAVPPGHYLLLGDQRDASDDARTWPRPYVARQQLVGRLVRLRRVAARRACL
ncbi:MAG: signal peptidase I [Cellulomonas sp. 73-92]|uniref:signal peptidase I n=1 Tax=Cellulomonas sp. 73-92 TaxID=1895740 RepID=UPI0009277D36|nr:signal peptidase I [Cellulomonas sp. 73-92]OJV80209.1 MAG: signal peptidase I [Cellulomonas sp. 73-92]